MNAKMIAIVFCALLTGDVARSVALADDDSPPKPHELIVSTPLEDGSGRLHRWGTWSFSANEEWLLMDNVGELMAGTNMRIAVNLNAEDPQVRHVFVYQVRAGEETIKHAGNVVESGKDEFVTNRFFVKIVIDVDFQWDAASQTFKPIVVQPTTTTFVFDVARDS